VDVLSGKVTPLTPEGTAGRFVSPNGDWLTTSSDDGVKLFNLRTRTLTPVALGAGDGIAGWSADSSALFITTREEHLSRVFRLDVATGARTPLTIVQPNDAAGLVGVGDVLVAGDGNHYVYSYVRQLSQLYVVQLQQP
jgi:hypothetical protein